jgi:2-phosphosulfolactate phosphatase
MAGTAPLAVTVVVDVIRAFTTAAAAFAAGAQRVICAESVEQARALATVRPSALLAGELWGLPPADFDAGNSPHELCARDLRGRDVILVALSASMWSELAAAWRA